MTSNAAPEEPSKPSEKKRMDDQLWLGLMLLGTFAVIAFLAWLFTDQFEVKSSCKAISGGTSCSITHTSDSSQSISVCMHVKRVCENGMASTAKECFNGLIAAKKLSQNAHCKFRVHQQQRVRGGIAS